MRSASALLSPYHSWGWKGSSSTWGRVGVEGPIAASEPASTSRGRCPAATMASHRKRVPSALTRMKSSRVAPRRTPARWKTTSWPATAGASEAGTVTSPSTRVWGTPARPEASPPGRNRHVTASPRAARAFANQTPRKPPAPVMRALMGRFIQKNTPRPQGESRADVGFCPEGRRSAEPICRAPEAFRSVVPEEKRAPEPDFRARDAFRAGGSRVKSVLRGRIFGLQMRCGRRSPREKRRRGLFFGPGRATSTPHRLQLHISKAV